MEIKRSFWYSALNLCRIPFYVPAVWDEERRPVYFKYLLDVTSILDITLPVLPSHYRAFHAVHFKQISHRHSEAIITPIRLCPHAYVCTIVHRTQTHTHVRCSSVRQRASATGRPCMALYPPPNVFTFVGPLLNAFSSPATMIPDIGTYVHTETVNAYLSMRTCVKAVVNRVRGRSWETSERV